MQNEYAFEVEKLRQINNSLKKVSTQMEGSFQLSQNLLNALKDNENWKGQFRNEFIAFYHLLLQYHGQLCGKTAQAIGDQGTVSAEMNPIQKMQSAVEELLDNINQLPESSENYKALKDVMKEG